jgi:acyl transferase domain-containing protein
VSHRTPSSVQDVKHGSPVHSGQRRTDEYHTTTEVVALSSRHPGPSLGADGFWQSLNASANLQQSAPLSRWDNEVMYSPNLVPSRMTLTTRFGAFCDEIEQFDAAAFRLSTAEAVGIDPQVRQVQILA